MSGPPSVPRESDHLSQMAQLEEKLGAKRFPAAQPPADERERYILESNLSTRMLAAELGIGPGTVNRVRRGVRRQDPARRVVYFIEGAGLIKIGKTGDIAARLPGLQCGSPVPLTVLMTRPGYTELETTLHAHFADRKTHGEWFRVTLGEVEAFLARLDEVSQLGSPEQSGEVIA